MVQRLLSLALTVEQHDNRSFYWLILESFDNSMEFESLMESATGYPSYIEALEAGYAVLKSLSDDLKIGPQEEEEIEEVEEIDDHDEYA